MVDNTKAIDTLICDIVAIIQKRLTYIVKGIFNINEDLPIITVNSLFARTELEYIFDLVCSNTRTPVLLEVNAEEGCFSVRYMNVNGVGRGSSFIEFLHNIALAIAVKYFKVHKRILEEVVLRFMIEYVQIECVDTILFDIVNDEHNLGRVCFEEESVAYHINLGQHPDDDYLHIHGYSRVGDEEIKGFVQLETRTEKRSAEQDPDIYVELLGDMYKMLKVLYN